MFKWLLPRKKFLQSVDSRGGWWPLIRESFSGAWQQNIEIRIDSVLAFHAVFACTTLIASDISKLPIMVMKKDKKIWKQIPNVEYPVLKKPNGYQNWMQFLENWVISKLARGNTYILKSRDRKGNVANLYVLSPDMVKVLVTEGGEVFYQLSPDNMSNTEKEIVVPSSEIIHDRFNCLFHPLVGLSPIFACGLSAVQGLKIQNNSAKFFENMSRPGGILTAPGSISDETATRLKTSWELNYGGDNIGKIAVLGDDLKYHHLAISAKESELVDQLKLTAEIVCATYHVPKYKVVGDPPSQSNIEALEQQYYSQCLQNLIEAIELCLTEGLGVPEGKSLELDLDALLRMDTKTQAEVLKMLGGSGFISPNEAREKFNREPTVGGDACYLQQQNYSLEALNKRDSQEDPFATKSTTTPVVPDDSAKVFLAEFTKGLANVG